MDKEKINEAAEEAAIILYRNLSDPDVSEDGRTVSMFMSMFDSGVDWLMQQPLSERLTDEEKEKIIKRYNDELEVAQHHTLKMKESVNPTSRQFHANVREGYISRLKLLEQIFGSDLFREK